jgi:hypothetical protein
MRQQSLQQKVVVLLLSLLVIGVHSFCDLGWNRYGNYCYYPSPTASTWYKARAACRSMNAELFYLGGTVETTDEFNALEIVVVRSWVWFYI